MKHPSTRAFAVRDALAARILGTFFLVLSLPVTLGTFFAHSTIDRGINLAAGLSLILVGVAFVWRSVSLRRQVVHPVDAGEAPSD